MLRAGKCVQLEKHAIRKSNDTLSIWNKFAISHNVDETVQGDIAQEFSSAIKWQGSYLSSPDCQTCLTNMSQHIPMNTPPEHHVFHLLVSYGNNPSLKVIQRIRYVSQYRDIFESAQLFSAVRCTKRAGSCRHFQIMPLVNMIYFTLN